MTFRESLVCPQCKAPLPSDGVEARCPNNHQGYTWIEGRAVFAVALADRSKDNVLNQGILKRVSRHPLLSKLVKAAMSVDIVYKTRESRTRLTSLASRFEGKKALNVGSGSTNYGSQFINVDIGPFPNVHVVTTSHSLPFPDDYFDLVVSQAVLEHVADPGAAVKEMIRVLKPGGELYAEIPFLQGFHPTPEDFQRYTISGIEQLFSDTEKLSKGVVNGPASALCWILREFMAILCSFGSQTLYKIGLVVFAWLVFPIKFFDIFLERSRFAPIIASGLYFHGIKRVRR